MTFTGSGREDLDTSSMIRRARDTLRMRSVGSVRRAAGRVSVEILLTSGWCPFPSRVLTEIQDRIQAQPGVDTADVQIVWDEAWTTARLSERAAGLLRFLPALAQVPDRDAYVAAHQPGNGDPS